MTFAVLSAQARTRPHYGGTLRVEVAGDGWHGEDAVAPRLVFDGLTALDASGTLRPALAVNWQTEDEGHHWQFRLRPAVRFHDGSPLTSMAVVQSLNLACLASCPWTSVHTVGSTTVVFSSDMALPNLPAMLASDQFLISLTHSPDGKTLDAPIGTGPFQIAGSGGVVTLTAYENCWQGRPFADQVILTTHRAVRDQWLDVAAGRADLVEVPVELFRQAQQQRLEVVESQPVEVVVLQISESGALANPVLRSALSYAVDRSALYSVIFQKQGSVTASLLPQSGTGYAFLFPTGRDLAKATQLRGGLNAGTLTLAADGDGAMQLTAQRLALNLHEAGFSAQFAGAMDKNHADLLLRTLPIAGSDGGEALGRLLLAAGKSPAVAAHAPEALFQAERDVLNQHTIIPLLDLPRAFAVDGRVRDLALRADGSADLANSWVEDAP